MHSMKAMLSAVGTRISRFHGKRITALALVVAIMAGSLLAFPAVAEEETVSPVLTPVRVQTHPLKVLENNLEAIDAATVPMSATYTGEVVPFYNVTVKADAAAKTLCLPAGTTVSEAVAVADVTLGKADLLSVSADRVVADGLIVSVTRVQFKEYQKTYSIAYTTEVRYTSELRQGASKVLQEGVKGQRVVTYIDRLEDGKVISTEKSEEKVTKQPTNKIILKGTKVGKVVSEAPWDILLDSAGQPINYKKKLTGKCTAYTTDRGDSGAWTATGQRAQVGIVAVDPRVIPYGTKLWIVSADGKTVYGYAVAGDTGGAARSGKIIADLFYDTYVECERFGRRTMNVYIL